MAQIPPPPPLRIFVTVGSTSFAALLARLLSPSFLSVLPRSCHVTIQYGRSELATVLASLDEQEGSLSTSSQSSVIYDEGSRLVPQVGLRASKSQGLSYKGSQLNDLDPGRTGSLQGWQMAASTSTLQASRTSQKKTNEDVSSEESTSEDENDEDHSGPSGSGNVAFSTLPPSLTFQTSSGVELTLIDFVPDLGPHLAQADIVIAHAGAGTLLETLRFQRPTQPSKNEEAAEDVQSPSKTQSTTPLLIIVPNTTLMGNHQDELAEAIAAGGWAWKASLEQGKPSSLEDVLREVVDIWEQRTQRGKQATAKDVLVRPRPFPAAKPERFRRLVDEVMGFTDSSEL